MKQNDFSILIIKPLLEQKFRLFQIFISLILIAIMQSLFLLAIGPFLKALFSLDPQSVSLIPATDIFPPGSFAFFPSLKSMFFPRIYLVWGAPLLFLVAGLGKSLSTYMYQLNQQTISLYITKCYRQKLFSAILSMPYIEIRKKSAGQWMSIIMNDVLFLQARFSEIATSFLRDTVLVVSCLAALALLHWKTALIIFAIAPFIALVLGKVSKKIAFFANTWQNELARLVSTILSVRERFNFIRAQSGSEAEKNRFIKFNDSYYSSIRRSIFIRSVFAPMMEFLGFAIFAGFIFAFAHGFLVSDLSGELVVEVFAALGLILKPLKNLGEQVTRYNETKGTLKQSLDTFKMARNFAVYDKKENSKPIISNEISIHEIQTGYDNVCFSTCDLSFFRGKPVAIIGPSGAGKTTFLRTLAGLIQPQTWEGSLTWQQFISLVSFVSQQPFLFDDTLENNLLYGENKQCDKNIMWEALKTVNIDLEVKDLKDGLNTKIRAIASNLSGGQVQRLVIARALLRSKSFLLLDEATSAIDIKTEQDITERLISNCRSKNEFLIVVTHRLNWLHLFDEVLFIENGKIILHGSHEHLMEQQRYNEFYKAAN